MCALLAVCLKAIGEVEEAERFYQLARGSHGGLSSAHNVSPRTRGAEQNEYGAVDGMEEVAQVETLSMGWCLECHRNPEPHLRPRESVTDLSWTRLKTAAELLDQGRRIRRTDNINPSTDCSTCHR